MQVLSLALQGFMNHQETSLEFPHQGVVLITGPNGAGKSALIVGVSTALWGETLKRPPWRTEIPGSVKVTTPSFQVERQHRRGKTSLAFQLLTPEAEALPQEKGASTPKTQELLDAFVGSWEVWRHTHVFTRQDAVAFTQATDGERKRFLEGMLGLQGFDVALERCREELREVKIALRNVEQEHAILKAQEEQIAQRLQTLTSELESLARPTSQDAQDSGAAFLEELEEFQTITGEKEAFFMTLKTEEARDRAEASALGRQLLALDVRVGVCPTCRRPLEEETAREALAVHRVELAKQHQVALQRAEKIRDALPGVQGELRTLQARLSGLQATQQAATQYQTVQALLRRQCEEAQRIQMACQERLRVLGAVQEQRQNTLAVLLTAEMVLGIRGVRGHVLARTMERLGSGASWWLAKLGRPTWKVALSPIRQTQRGDTTEEIAMEIEGPLHVRGYPGLSAGEQKRVDLAFMLALGDLSQGSPTEDTPGGTLWFDEALDPPLDAEGACAMAEVLHELARHRCVVVIAHSPDVALTLRPCQHHHVEAGVLRRLR